MWNWLKITFFLQLLLILAVGCNDKSDDPYFARPDWLASPIYQNLQEQGNFTMFLKCIDKTSYADVLKRAGSFTVFAPNDDAFAVYLSDNGLSSVEDIDAETAIDIVSYAMVFTAYTYEEIDDAHSNVNVPFYNTAYRRKSNNYKGVYKETTLSDGEINVVDINRVLDPDDGRGIIPILNVDDNNYKYLQVLTEDFFQNRGLTSFDYNYFYPDVQFSGFNVFDARVLKRDIMAENGYIHEVDKVLEPLKNIDESLVGRDEYSMFKGILDKYLVNYNLAPDEFVDRFSKATGNTEPVYVKSYPWLLFSPNTETIVPSSTVSEDQFNSFTLFAPTNQAVQKFFDDKFLVYYKTLDNMSDELISDFVNSHLFSSTVWPSRFELAETKFTDDDIFESEVVSNGLFYGTQRVQESDDFFTVYGEINLNPKYSLMLQGLKDLDLQYIIKNSNLPYTVFMVSDSVMTDFGFSYDPARESWGYTEDPSIARESLNRFLRMHIVRRNITDLSAESMILTYGGEYIKQVDGNLFAAGNIDFEETPRPEAKDEVPNNGTTYKFLEKPLKYSTKAPIEHLEATGKFKYFTDFIKGNADLYDVESRKIRDLNGGVPNTIFAMSDATIFKAIFAGDLPRSTSPGSIEEQTKVKNFFRYHFLLGKSLAQGVVTSGQFQTAYKDTDGKTYMTVISDEFGNLSIIDRSGQTVAIKQDNNNILSNRVVIHELDGYLNPYEIKE